MGCTGSGNRQPVFENVQEIDVTSFDEIESSNPVEVYKTEPKYIRLNNLENAKYTFSKIEKMVIRKDLLYILDYKARRLMAFDMEGNPVKVIDYRGRGPKEYLQIFADPLHMDARETVLSGYQVGHHAYDEILQPLDFFLILIYIHLELLIVILKLFIKLLQ